ncbi:MAG: pyruvate formate lyase family protein [Lentisphaeria bacterium]|nr:MAG: pyruvate formate lyase family protein [Lentisphaeria bacterium]
MSLTAARRSTTWRSTGAGLAVVADSFAAVQQFVEEEKSVSWRELAEQLRADFQLPGGRRSGRNCSPATGSAGAGAR